MRKYYLFIVYSLDFQEMEWLTPWEYYRKAETTAENIHEALNNFNLSDHITNCDVNAKRIDINCGRDNCTGYGISVQEETEYNHRYETFSYILSYMTITGVEEVEEFGDEFVEDFI